MRTKHENVDGIVIHIDMIWNNSWNKGMETSDETWPWK